MAEDNKNGQSISKTNSGFPGYLDFDRLRREGIEYLGKLAGNLWTDHNVHDPGITMLEMLSYAILDLGYRTNLPAVDFFTKNPADKSKVDDNFFTPAQILACNPLTITDYRKLLIDVKGVRNAWLEPATDVRNFCKQPPAPNPTPVPGAANPAGDDNGCPPCDEFLNGLYHVYLDLENGAEDQDVIGRVRAALMGHRNLCEDFVDVFVLCKLPVGVCAEIELEENAKADEVYLNTATALRGFFTPVPQFYTLQQLLDKGKSTEEIFAGRPYNLMESYGFVDTEEFEKIKLKKEIHLSDVYSVVNGVAGVRSVRNLSLRLCDSNQLAHNWKFPIRKNHIPEFSVACSGFRFTRNGAPVQVDFEKFAPLLEINFNHGGKVAYQSPSPHLDLEIPRGVFRNDMAAYYSIQNEFPQVYGIGEGELPDGAPDERVAQALQLKGFLLFFDQLLANYLAQITNIRSLFALSSPGDAANQHTYFINQLRTVPELQKLLRFPAEENGASSLGEEGTALAFPVDKKKLLQLLEQNRLAEIDLEKTGFCDPGSPDGLVHAFPSMTDQSIAISQWRDDFYHNQVTSGFVTKPDGRVFYYLFASSGDVALLGKRYFDDEGQAQQDVASLEYIGTFEENYRTYSKADGTFSFNIELNLLSYSTYLQLVVEDRKLYLQRRREFLDHLLARFAEKFSDYAALSFGELTNDLVEEAKIKATERFLAHYDDLSSNRGKAYDYLADGWKNDNVSGFLKRVKALTGMEEWGRHSLCNFVVDKYPEQYLVDLNIAGTGYFSMAERFDSRAEAQQAAANLFAAVGDRMNYRSAFIAHEQSYAIDIVQNNQVVASFKDRYASEDAVNTAIGNLGRMFSDKAAPGDTFVSQYIYHLQLTGHQGHAVRTSLDAFDSAADARSAIARYISAINSKKRWEPENEPQPGKLLYVKSTGDRFRFIDVDAFKIDINNTIVGKPDKFTYDLLDKNNRFKFKPTVEFEDESQARKHSHELLKQMVHRENYRAQKVGKAGNFTLVVTGGESDMAVSYAQYDSEAEAQKVIKEILSILGEQQYELVVKELPHRWKFSYFLGIAPPDLYVFHSVSEYDGQEKALKAATAFVKAVGTVKLRKTQGTFRLSPPAKSPVSPLALAGDAGDAVVRPALAQLLDQRKEIVRLARSSSPKAFDASIDIDEVSKQGQYVYRLVDKDNLPARYSGDFVEKAEAESARKALAKIKCGLYGFLEICLGGSDIIDQKKDAKTKAVWYHYLVKCRNKFDKAGKELVLFESVRGYETPEDAEAAFDENYLQIFFWATKQANYGTLIGLEETLAHSTDPCVKTSDAVVFVPKATLDELGGHDQASVRALMIIALSYPIRLIEVGSEEYDGLFPCEKSVQNPGKKDCGEEAIKYRYYFRLDVPGQAEGYWISTQTYENAETARAAFRFFLVLLCYPGNLVVQCDPCLQGRQDHFRIFMREVLAESADRYMDEASAWGKEGVQRFICTSQTPGSFHNYLRKSDCCYSFYVACRDGLAYHPCQYESPQNRAKAIDHLYLEFNKFIKNKSYQYTREEIGWLLHDEHGEAFARVSGGNSDNISDCDLLVKLSDVIARGTATYQKGDGDVIIMQNDAGLDVRSMGAGHTIDQWRDTLESFACYFPIVRTSEGKGAKYCIEIKYPGFNTCGQDAMDDVPCGCEGEAVEISEPACHVAWKSRCCYTSCDEAQEKLQAIYRLLADYENYQSTFDCSCYSYGIDIYSMEKIVTSPDNDGNESSIFRSSEIEAFNPQCYPNPEEACDAVERAKRLINDEGLHLVEHILLRPRCPEDCECERHRAICEDQFNCCFTWKDASDDPCVEDREICFQPGADPYSFVATVVLPAWPARFRRGENRQLLENIIYREAPAHVLVRILWLAPHDFCCFEGQYKKWGRWLAKKPFCNAGFSPCGFMGFLFHRNFECLEDCAVCGPCEEDRPPTDPCFDRAISPRLPRPNDNDYLNQIDGLFCWRRQSCDGYEFVPCDQQQIPGETPRPAPAGISRADQPEAVTAAPVARRTVPNRDRGKGTPPKTSAGTKNGEKSRKGPTPSEKDTEAKMPSKPGLKPKPQLVNSRLAGYRATVDAIVEKSKNNPLAAKVQVFLKDPDPSPERLSKLLGEVVQNKKPKDKNAKALTARQVDGLLSCAVRNYLDKICFHEKGLDNIEALEGAFEKLQKSRVDTQAIYQAWKPEEVEQYEPGLALDRIEYLLTGEKH